MQKYLLPADLNALDDPGKLDKLAEEVRDGAVRLDWSRVTVASPLVLMPLVGELDRERHVAALGLETASPAIRPMIEMALQLADMERAQRAAQDAPEEEETPEEPDVVTAALQESGLLAPPDGRVIRDELVALALQDLHGPAGGEEEVLIGDTPDERYIVGSLAPRNASQTASDLDEEELNGLAPAGKDGSEEPVADAGAATLTGRWLRPRSLGLTFAVDRSVSEIVVRATWGVYRRMSADEAGVDLPDEDASKRVWQRIPCDSGPIRIPLDQPAFEEELFEADGRGNVRIKAKSRARTGDSPWLVTLFLVNDRIEERPKAESWLFQAQLQVESPERDPIFRARDPRNTDGQLPEEAELEMIYRRRCEFAVGHGIAVNATPAATPGRAIRLTTVAAPEYEVPAVDIPTIDGLEIDMRELAALDGAALGAALRPLTAAYGGWIDEQQASIAGDATLDPYLSRAGETLATCRTALERIEAGIRLIETDPDAARAFRFMQEAMADQRVHSTFTRRRREGQVVTLAECDVPKERSWRPFQLAFILLNLPALTDPTHPERATESSATADLLWFPTGGGKTEAYLGLTAYTLAIRRLQGEIGERTGAYGVAVLMRYTLRLLTLQQFQRAAALICACELLRERDPDTWGTEPFRLGLWVGRASTPNTTAQAKDALEQNIGAGTPAQLTTCPWCGSEIDPKPHLLVEMDRRRTLIFCGDKLRACPFSRPRRPQEGLPVVVVDEEIYRQLPSLIIATVDKFARLPWVGETRNLFGNVDKRCERHGFWAPDLEDAPNHRAKSPLPAAKSGPALPARPIDLIIQDELHLISGPLGSMVGLYESVIDGLLTWEVDGVPVRPKVVASTATIRRAGDQVMALFARGVQVFPPSGLDVANSFFAKEQPVDEQPGRRYVGICVPGMRHKAVLIRVYVALMAAAQTLRERYGAAVVDPYLTLLGYFSSIRELGGMVRVVEDDVSQRLQRMDERGFAKRVVTQVQELTSRLSSADIPGVLARLERPFTDEKTPIAVSPYDVVLATNMISVGVDVGRLGLMVVAGQPKATAEYIQATSRVGRGSTLGLVFTVFHGNRPRDLSHYERFAHDHATFYRQVEPLSVTPFSEGAIERGLASILVSYLRHRSPGLGPNEAAAMIRRDTPELAELRALLERRAAALDIDNELTSHLLDSLQSKIDHWVARSELSGPQTLGYELKQDGRTLGLLDPPDGGHWKPFTSPMSMRNVEPSVRLLLRNPARGDQEFQ